MASLVAIDVAVLPPPPVARQAVALSAALPRRESKGLRLDETHLPHITLTQQFVDVAELSTVSTVIGRVLEGIAPLPLRVTGPGRGSSSVWMQIDLVPSLRDLHRQLMDALEGFERPGGDRAAFADSDARPADVRWVSRFRAESAYGCYTPHITLGHAAQPPHVEPSAFAAATVALCQLGRFCTCRRILRQWTLYKTT